MLVIPTTKTHLQNKCVGHRDQNSRLNSKKLDPWICSIIRKGWFITTKMNYFRTFTHIATIFINNKSMFTIHHAHGFGTFWWFLNKIKMISKNLNWQCLFDMDIPPSKKKNKLTKNWYFSIDFFAKLINQSSPQKWNSRGEPKSRELGGN